MFWNVTEYYKSIGKDPWDALPITFHIDNGLEDPEYFKFLDFHADLDKEITEKIENKHRILSNRSKVVYLKLIHL